jgi:hypothetical protein
VGRAASEAEIVPAPAIAREPVIAQAAEPAALEARALHIAPPIGPAAPAALQRGQAADTAIGLAAAVVRAAVSTVDRVVTRAVGLAAADAAALAEAGIGAASAEADIGAASAEADIGAAAIAAEAAVGDVPISGSSTIWFCSGGSMTASATIASSTTAATRPMSG